MLGVRETEEPGTLPGHRAYSLNVQSIDFLQTVAERSMSQLTIHIDLDTLSKEDSNATTAENGEVMTASSTLTDLTTIIRESPGNTQLAFNIRESRLSTQPVRMVSRLPGIKVNRRLVDFIRSHEGMSFSM